MQHTHVVANSTAHDGCFAMNLSRLLRLRGSDCSPFVDRRRRCAIDPPSPLPLEVVEHDFWRMEECAVEK
jgi:hypothetical protein